jgi:gamma-glutamyl-gamma-aminobutyrate hydrolase PuuD
VIDQIKASGSSSFLKAAFYDCKIKGTTFKKCPLNNSTLIRSEMENTSLYGLDLTGANWIESKLSQVKIEQGKLSGSSFLLTSATDSQLIDCDLKDALLLDAKSGFKIQGGTPHVITKPIVALGWNFKGEGPMTRLISKALQDNGALVLKYVKSGDNYSSFETQLEVDALKALKNITPSELSIGQQLLLSAAPDSEIDFLKRRAAAILKHVHGLVIPGGEDIEERFYNPSAKVKVSYRSLIEIALLGEAKNRNVPTMGICRGAQMINVFFGGTLDDVHGEWGADKLEWTDSPHKENLQQVLTKDYIGESRHKQAVKQVGKDLTVVLKRGKVPKMLISNDGNFIASQVHPEVYIDRTKDFPEILSDMKVFKGKTVAEVHAFNSSETKTKIKNIFKEATSKIEEEPLKTYFNDIENIASSLMKELIKETTFITTNKNLYQYFLEKVLRFRSSSFNP